MELYKLEKGEATYYSMMFDLNNFFGIHLELSEKCNLACPMCLRQSIGANNFGSKEIDLDQLFNAFDPVTDNLGYFWLSGNYSDPATHSNLIRFVDHYHDKSIVMTSHVGLRTTKFWTDLGQRLNRKNDDYSSLIASIDGLEDTNSLYRINSNWKKTIDNCKAFIDSGGHAVWKFIIFDHNKHQVQEAHDYALELGFNEFIVVNSARFEYTLKNKIKPTPFIQSQLDVKCEAKRHNMLFVDHNGVLFPCCWTAARFKEHGDFGDESEVKLLLGQYDYLNEMNLFENGLDVLDHPFFEDLELLWDAQKPYVCQLMCGKKIKDEWIF